MKKTKASKGWWLSCTAIIGVAGYCETPSPATKTVRGMRGAAIRAGWRVWGKGEPGLIDGEALCPAHVTTKPPAGERP